MPAKTIDQSCFTFWTNSRYGVVSFFAYWKRRVLVITDSMLRLSSFVLSSRAIPSRVLDRTRKKYPTLLVYLPELLRLTRQRRMKEERERYIGKINQILICKWIAKRKKENEGMNDIREHCSVVDTRESFKSTSDFSRGIHRYLIEMITKMSTPWPDCCSANEGDERDVSERESACCDPIARGWNGRSSSSTTKNADLTTSPVRFHRRRRWSMLTTMCVHVSHRRWDSPWHWPARRRRPSLVLALTDRSVCHRNSTSACRHWPFVSSPSRSREQQPTNEHDEYEGSARLRWHADWNREWTDEIYSISFESTRPLSRRSSEGKRAAWGDSWEDRSYEECTDTEVTESTDFTDNLLFAGLQLGVAIDDQDEIIHRFAVFVDIGDLSRFSLVLVEFVFFVQIDVQQATENMSRDESIVEWLNTYTDRSIDRETKRRRSLTGGEKLKDSHFHLGRDFTGHFVGGRTKEDGEVRSLREDIADFSTVVS